ncbi:hypothetical protein [Cyclobacterium xiamenense]|uniref:hypothetical protein n=1 Tax=Cyclobacterium xiamenense TaxID=1297121 RepID=UPI0035D04ECD
MTDLYFIQYSYKVSPKNKYHEWIDARFESLDRSLTRNPRKLEKELIEEIKSIRESTFPRCKPVRFLTETYMPEAGMLKVEVYELGRLVMIPVKEVRND